MSIIVFSGSSHVGKTTLARKLAGVLHFKFVSFGDYVRDEAARRGIAATRQNLQDLGRELAETDMFSFCKQVLKSAGYVPGVNIVIDGVRHLEALEAITTLSQGEQAELVYLHASMEVRKARTGPANADVDLRIIDKHPVESQTDVKLRQRADLVVDASGSIEEAFSKVTSWIRENSLDKEVT